LGDRARFLAVRLPFVLRLHARLGVAEVTADSLVRLEQTARTLQRLAQTEPLIGDLTSLAAETRKTTEEARATLGEMRPLIEKLPPPAELQRLLAGAERLNDKVVPVLDRVQAVLAELDRLLPDDSAHAGKTLATAEQRAESLLRRAVLYLVGVGLAWSLLFWGGYCAAKLTLARVRARRRRGPHGRLATHSA
jgi:hypothetical protein